MALLLSSLSRWSLSRWLLFARLLQAMGSLLTAVMNGWLLVYIHSHKLGLAKSMTSLESMACVVFVYSAVVLLAQHAGYQRWRSRTSSTPIIAAFIVGDVVYNGVTTAMLTVLARNGLPNDCHGLTRLDFAGNDAPNQPPAGYQTIRFGNEELDTKGALDKFCALERGFYIIAIVLVFTYMLTVALGALRIAERHWLEKGRVDPLFASTDNVYGLNPMTPKIQSPDPSRDPEAAISSSEGVLTTTSRSAPTLQTQGVVASESLHRNQALQQQSRTYPSPVSPVSAASPISQVSPISPAVHQRGSLMPSPGALDASAGDLMISQAPDPGAEATVVDGYRPPQHPGMPSLPPYSPGSSRGQFMQGHGDESNEMRLSEYVKGETRAQNMKDSGRGL
ncbi:hypothetical protein GGR52DRAFT_390951 [Hypoxylon sp. FL1284]|nr:hypothetical protein GGR52DRAFT_390951 [Hypoxylon sp. FL1284]